MLISLKGRKMCYKLQVILQICICLVHLFQRNHSLFGSVMSALTGHKATMPFANRTQSLHINYTQSHQKVSPTNSLNAPHTDLSPQNSMDGKVTPSNSCNHLNVEYLNAINRSPSQRSNLRISPVPPASSVDSRRPSKIR